MLSGWRYGHVIDTVELKVVMSIGMCLGLTGP